MKRWRYAKLAGAMAGIVLINTAAWKSTPFCDWYVKNIHPFWVNIYARIMGMYSFSVGEIMLAAGLAATASALFCGMIAAAAAVRHRGASYSAVVIYCKKYLKGYAWGFVITAAVMTLNCFIPYHSSTLEEKYGIPGRMEASIAEELLSKEYSLEELGRLRDYIVIRVNQLSAQVERDAYGNIIYPENMEELIIESMQRLGEEFDQLSGYYPRPKQLAMSGFFSQQMIKGYFFPFSMEANYNSLMHEINRPATICHEYAHLKGFMYEEDANMIGFLACINSPEVTLQYSGFLSVLNYVNNEFYEAVGRDDALYASHPGISSQVSQDNVFLEKETWEEVEERAVIRTEIVDKVSDKFTETTMVLNGIEDGMRSYTRVVQLLLHYYDGSPELQQLLSANPSPTSG